MIGSIRLGRARARRIKETGSWGMRWDAFAGSGFHVVLHGRGWLITADDPPRALGQGDVVLAPSGARHGLSHVPRALDDLPPGDMSGKPQPDGHADFEFLCGAYHLEHGQVHEYLLSLPDFIVASPDDGDPELASLVDLLIADLSQAGPGTEATRSALLDLLLVHVLRGWLRTHPGPDWPLVRDPAVVAALRHIHREPHRPWTVSQLSAVVGMSRTAFTRHFTGRMGKPPRVYLTGVRLSQGARLLRETDAPLAVIARQIGYSTEFAFGTAFRREYGISPGRFRDGARTAPVVRNDRHGQSGSTTTTSGFTVR
ncbi:AraC family transcriptional regulator [Actinacidiphila oryziradicis]|uniref:AraC family transcriptional regulator n=2 Tax=Actinacidiphila oryziradicis TaxID=2571141 RepID=A0A4U0RRG8_9ACTN|nr:AraC family transcriptional regulator [Actinacidiphila oryziradicis]